MNSEGSGVFVDDTGNNIFHHSAVYYIGTLHAVKGVFEETGFMVFTPSDGDKVFATYKGSGTLGKTAKGTYTYTGGTGKCDGVESSGEFSRYSLQYANEGVWTYMNLSKGNYKLP